MWSPCTVWGSWCGHVLWWVGLRWYVSEVDTVSVGAENSSPSSSLLRARKSVIAVVVVEERWRSSVKRLSAPAGE